MDTSIIVLIILVILILAGLIFPFLHMWVYNVKKVFVDPILAEKRLQVLKQQFSEIDKYFDGKATQKIMMVVLKVKKPIQPVLSVVVQMLITE
jgi:hypothetical protein